MGVTRGNRERGTGRFAEPENLAGSRTKAEFCLRQRFQHCYNCLLENWCNGPVEMPAEQALAVDSVAVGAVPAGGCKQGPWTLWDSYQTRFIDGQGRVIDHTSGDRTTSEGQAYAMFFALVNNDRATLRPAAAVDPGEHGRRQHGEPLPGWLWGHAPERAVEAA